MEKKEIIKALDEVADELYSKLGTDSYVMRCTLYDVRKAIESVAKPLKEMIMQMFSDASVMNGASFEERSIPDYNYDSLADAILAFEPTDSVVSQREKREYITCAANWFNDGKEYLHQPTNIKEGFVVCGHRHHNVFMTVSLIRGEDFRVSDYGKVTQGFLTSHDRFVDREEAGVIAFREKQITKWTNCLFSEDLY